MTENTDDPEGQDDNLAVIVAPHLPFLRRFGRAVTGGQAHGDSYVADVLRALIADRDRFDQDLPARVALYKLFLEVWGGAEEEARSQGADGIHAERAVSRLTSRSRLVLLLATVEEFALADIQRIMGIGADDAQALLAAARRDLTDQTAARIMIVEDEPVIALDLEAIVGSMGHCVTGAAATHRDAVTLAGQTEPDLILADIQLADGSSGIDAVEEILTKVQVPVIFITAFPERLLTGERPEPTYLITKPYRPEMVEAAIAQALFHGKAI